MWMLILGLALFFGAHLVLPRLRGQMTDNVVKLGVSLLSFIGLALVVVGYGAADYSAVYTPLGVDAAKPFTHALMPLAAILIVAAQTPNNIKRYVPHPMSTGVLIWAALHLLVRGDLASVLLFGAFGAFAAFNIATGSRPARLPVATRWDLITVVAGLVFYAAVLWAHGAIGGVYLFG